MKRRLRLRLYWQLYVRDSAKPFLVDLCFVRLLIEKHWAYEVRNQRCRAWFNQEGTRKFLHRYIVELAGKHFAEATFANGDPHDCRLANIRPYKRDEDGASRRLFKNTTTGRRGVGWHSRNKAWYAAIRVRGKLHHLGYYGTADAAADAYAKAWLQAYPNKKLQ